MHTLRLSSLLAFLAWAWLTPASATPAAQTPSPTDLLERSGQAMEGVQSMRFSGPMELRMSGGDSSSSLALTMSMEGEFQRPDRAHVRMDLGLGGLTAEVITIGDEGWMRSGGDDWDTMSMDQTGSSMRPWSFAEGNRDTGRYVMNPTVIDTGDSYRLSGDLDLASAMADGASAASMVPGGMSSFPADLGAATARVTLIIDKATGFMSEMEMNMAFPMAEMGGDMSLRLNMGFSGFDDPTIVIEPPM